MEKRVFQKTAARKDGQSDRFVDGDDVVVDIQDGNVKGNGRFIPRRAVPVQDIPGNQNGLRGHWEVAAGDFAMGQMLAPTGLGEVGIVLRIEGQSRLARCFGGGIIFFGSSESSRRMTSLASGFPGTMPRPPLSSSA